MANVELASVQQMLTEHLLMLRFAINWAVNGGGNENTGMINMGPGLGDVPTGMGIGKRVVKHDECKAESDGRWHEKMWPY